MEKKRIALEKPIDRGREKREISVSLFSSLYRGREKRKLT